MYKRTLKFYVTLSALLIGTALSCNSNKIVYAKNQIIQKATDTSTTEEPIFLSLSDLPYDSAGSAHGSVQLDKNLKNGTLCLTLDGVKTYFRKGIGLHANGNIIYNLSNYSNKYTQFTTYVGVDDSQRNSPCDGVIFRFYKSNDKKTWTLIHDTGVIKKDQNGVKVSFDITGVSYLKLETDKYQTDYNDHAIFCLPQLLKSGYSESDIYDGYLPDLTTLKAEIDRYPENTDLAKCDELRYKVLQYTFIKRVGVVNLQQIYALNSKNKETLEWILQDSDTLSLFLNGGNPDGTYENAINVLGNLLSKHKADLSDAKDGFVYKKLMIALSLTHSTPVRLWTGKTQQSDPCTRYEIFKKLRLENKLIDKELFDKFPVENLRWITNNWIDDIEIEWLNFYARKKGESKQNPIPYELNPYAYITYGFGYNYSSPQYYDAQNYNAWDQKYYLKQFNIPYGTMDDHKLWMVFEQGGVCGALSKTGSNLQTSFGIPSVVIGQPGHAAYLVYKKDTNTNKGMWEIGNNISNWKGSEKGERLLNGWGSSKPHNQYNVSYVLLAQAVLDNYDTYASSQEYRMWANIYWAQHPKFLPLLNRALNIQALNYDAWYDISRYYFTKNNVTDEDYLEFSQQLMDTFQWYPLPLYDFVIRQIRPRLSSLEQVANLDTMLETTLKKATNATNTDVLQPAACKEMANHLLGIEDLSVAKFSFDGKDAGKIVLSEKYKNSATAVHYSLDGGTTWSTPSHDKEIVLSKQELQSITVDYGIEIQFLGATSVYKIDITKGATPNGLIVNDLENIVIGVNNTYEWSLDDGQTWHSYKNGKPDLSNDKIVAIRRAATGTSLPSDFKTFSFTKDSDDETLKYISIGRLSIAGYSSQEVSRAKNYADNVIDGNPNTIWHTLWSGGDNERYISLKVDTPVYISGLEYVPRSTELNGIITNATILTSLDGKEWTTVQSNISWARNNQKKFFKFDTPVPARFVKLVGVNAVGNFCSAAMINLYEDSTQKYEYDIHISYDISTITNQDVTATCVLPQGYSVSTGAAIHTFTENGTYDFQWKNELGDTGVITAEVDWIDKTPPTAEVQYDIVNPTNSDVCAVLANPSEEIDILNMPDDTAVCYTFTENGEFTFEFLDRAGNLGTATAVVDWIDKTPLDAVLDYSTESPTTDPVTVTIVQANKDYIVQNNDGKSSYTFEQNGTFTFELVDAYGNSLSLTAKVDWIKEKENKPSIPSEGGEEVDKPITPPSNGDKEDKPTLPSDNSNGGYNGGVILLPSDEKKEEKPNTSSDKDNSNQNSNKNSNKENTQSSNSNIGSSLKPKINIPSTKNKSTLYVGNKYVFTIKNKPKKAVYKWTSSNKKIATVNSKGVVVGKKSGKVKIQCTIKIGKKVQKITRTIYIKAKTSSKKK